MKLPEACKDVLDQLATVAEEIKEEDFSRPVAVLHHSTIGQHMRHTLEFFICLKDNLETGLINYDNRDHDKIIESDKFVALRVINEIKTFLDLHRNNFSLQLAVNYDLSSDHIELIDTNYFRELSYNIEHAIHHMALIKIGLKAVAPYVIIPDNFGVAVSTVKYHNNSGVSSGN